MVHENVCDIKHVTVLLPPGGIKYSCGSFKKLTGDYNEFCEGRPACLSSGQTAGINTYKDKSRCG
jgi:hypothetical protein